MASRNHWEHKPPPPPPDPSATLGKAAHAKLYCHVVNSTCQLSTAQLPLHLTEFWTHVCMLVMALCWSLWSDHFWFCAHVNWWLIQHHFVSIRLEGEVGLRDKTCNHSNSCSQPLEPDCRQSRCETMSVWTSCSQYGSAVLCGIKREAACKEGISLQCERCVGEKKLATPWSSWRLHGRLGAAVPMSVC